jgi:EmrB/QacA subfamily drug resistance transporter
MATPSTLSATAASRHGTVSNKWAALPALMAGTFMIVLDFFIVNVALPSVQRELGAGVAAIEWVVAGYGLTFAVFLIAAGRLGDRIGRRRTFSLGLLLFTAASAACGLAPNAAILVAARLVQGLAGAMLSPNVLAIIGVTYQGAERTRAITVYGLVMGIAAAGAQVLGGLIMRLDVLDLGWRSVFLVNLPIGCVSLAAAERLVPESRAMRARGLDLVGTLLLTAALAALLLPLVEGRQQGWPMWTWISLAAAPVMLLAFGRHQQWLAGRGSAPLLDPMLFGQRSLSTGLLTQLAFWCGQASFFLVLALYLQQGRGLDPLRAGLVFTILAVAYLVTSLRAPALTARYGRDLIATGALALAAGHGLLLAALVVGGPQEPLLWLAPGLVLIGAGMGLCITPLVATVLEHVSPEQAGAISGVLSTMQQLGNALGVALTGLVFFGTLELGIRTAFEVSLVQLGILVLGVAALTRILPAGRDASRTGARR